MLPYINRLFISLSVLSGIQARSSLRREQQSPSCTDISTPTTFSLGDISYVRVETAPNFAITPNSTQLVFEITNNANGVLTGCSLINVQIDGQWGDDSNYWFDCMDKNLEVDGNEYPLQTNAHIIWEDWKVSVNQSWVCDGE
ncbi:hypothetical protein M426DRAFT_79117 [Hypoxylon sp. CI-4A]|nr:hypothetical protein M426DRAFT_79117 [Hypoxylon sp. CI-4A]